MTSGPRLLTAEYLLGEKTSQLLVLATFTPLFQELFITIFTQKRLVVIRYHNHQCFHRAPSVGKLPSKAKDPNMTMKHGYPSPDANSPVFQLLLLLLLFCSNTSQNGIFFMAFSICSILTLLSNLKIFCSLRKRLKKRVPKYRI